MSLHTVPIPPARMITLSDRRDGSIGGNKRARYVPGEKLPLGIDASRLVGQWLDSIDNITVAAVGSVGGDLTVDTVGDVHEEIGIVSVDASDAVAGDVWRVSFELHPVSDQTIVDSVEVEIVSAT